MKHAVRQIQLHQNDIILCTSCKENIKYEYENILNFVWHSGPKAGYDISFDRSFILSLTKLKVKSASYNPF